MSSDSVRASVERWWQNALNTGTQINNREAIHERTAAANVTSGGWYGKIDTDTLYNDFLIWAADNGVEPVSKQAFTNVLYSVTGARRGRSRRNQGKGQMIYVAVFDSIDAHRGTEVPLDTAPSA